MTNKKNTLALCLLSLIFLLFTQSRLFAANDVVGTLIRTTNLSCFTGSNCPDPDTTNPGAIGSPDPSGIAYLNAGPGEGHLLISDGEVNEMDWLFSNQAINIFETDLSGDLLAGSNSLSFTDEPTGMAFNPNNLHVFISDDVKRRIFEVNVGADGVFGTTDDTVVATINTRNFDSTDPEGLAYDPTEGAIYLSDGVNAEVYKILPGPNGRFDGVSPDGDDILTSFDTLSLGVKDPEGIEWDPATGNLYISGRPVTRVAEVTTTGALVRMIDISAANASNPAGLALGPWSGVGTDPNPGVLNLYIVDRGVDNNTDPDENDGKLYEFSIPALPHDGAPSVSAGPDKVIDFAAACGGASVPPCTLLSGTVTDDGLPAPVTINWNMISGPGAVIFENQNAAETRASFEREGVYVLRLTADDSEFSANDDVQITVLPPSAPLTSVYVTTRTKNGTVGGISFGYEDILRYDVDTDTWAVHFDGSNVGLSTDLNGFHIMADGSILFTLKYAAILPDVGSVDSMDIVRFIPTSLGENNTAGLLELHFKGANVGLGPSSADAGERINAIGFLPDGRLVVSTSGSFSVPGVTGKDEDLIAFTATSLGETTSGTWQLYFDGSDVDLSDGGDDEEIEGVWVGSNGDIYLTAKDSYSVPGLSGDGADIFRCMPLSTGSDTNCVYDLVWSGSAHGLSGHRLNGIHLASGAAGNSTPSVTIGAPANNATFAPGASVTFTGTASDTEDGNLTGSLAWNSSLDGTLGSGGSITSTNLSVGTHVITAAATDSGGFSGSDTINVIISSGSSNSAPSVTIGAPANNATFAPGASVTFTGTASDTEDGNLTGSLAWNSSLDGTLGSGGSITSTNLSVGTHVITAAATDSGGVSGSDTINVIISSGSSSLPAGIYVSSPSNGNVGGVSFRHEDILRYDVDTDTWSIHFDGSNVGLESNLNSFHIMTDGSSLLALRLPAILPDVGSVDSTDIVRFIPTALGESTAGRFELYFKGAAVGLDKEDGEKINAIGLLPDGRLVISTSGSINVPGVSGKDEDLSAFTATSLGETTSGTWQLYFDGSDVGLGGNSAEDVVGVSFGDNGSSIYLSTKGNFSVPGLSGDGADIFRCTPSSIGSKTSCTFDLFWRGSDHGLSVTLNGIQVVP